MCALYICILFLNSIIQVTHRKSSSTLVENVFVNVC